MSEPVGNDTAELTTQFCRFEDVTKEVSQGLLSTKLRDELNDLKPVVTRRPIYRRPALDAGLGLASTRTRYWATWILCGVALNYNDTDRSARAAACNVGFYLGQSERLFDIGKYHRFIM
jgi:hypothetical protein